jgi:hypothetical protein
MKTAAKITKQIVAIYHKLTQGFSYKTVQKYKIHFYKTNRSWNSGCIPLPLPRYPLPVIM